MKKLLMKIFTTNYRPLAGICFYEIMPDGTIPVKLLAPCEDEVYLLML